MTYGLYLLTEYLPVRYEETVYLCIGADAAAPVVDVIEAIDGIILDSLVLLIPRLVNLVRICPVGKADLWRYVDVFEHRECSTDRNAVLPAVSPVLDEVRLHQFILLCGNGVGDVSGIAHVYLLIPAVLTHLL